MIHLELIEYTCILNYMIYSQNLHYPCVLVSEPHTHAQSCTHAFPWIFCSACYSQWYMLFGFDCGDLLLQLITLFSSGVFPEECEEDVLNRNIKPLFPPHTHTHTNVTKLGTKKQFYTYTHKFTWLSSLLDFYQNITKVLLR